MSQHNFFELTAHWAMSAVESVGLVPTGEYFKLNSYENRVYDIFLEKEESPKELQQHIIIKIYRPQRWSVDALKEEQIFLNDLATNGVPVIQPYLWQGNTLHQYKGLYFALFKKGIGRLPQELSLQNLQSLGRILAHTHNIGETRCSDFRPTLCAEDYGWKHLERMEEWVAPEVSRRYFSSAETILNFLDDHLEPSDFLRIHGDCHRGNIIMNDIVDQKQHYPPFLLVDFDDFCNGPAVQDFWMLLSGPLSESKPELEHLIKGYEEFRTFPNYQVEWIEALRGLRIIHYASWIAKRWNDPIFPKYFPQFQDYIYWAEETEVLENIAWKLTQQN